MIINNNIIRNQAAKFHSVNEPQNGIDFSGYLGFSLKQRARVNGKANGVQYLVDKSLYEDIKPSVEKAIKAVIQCDYSEAALILGFKVDGSQNMTELVDKELSRFVKFLSEVIEQEQSVQKKFGMNFNQSYAELLRGIFIAVPAGAGVSQSSFSIDALDYGDPHKKEIWQHSSFKPEVPALMAPGELKDKRFICKKPNVQIAPKSNATHYGYDDDKHHN